MTADAPTRTPGALRVRPALPQDHPELGALTVRAYVEAGIVPVGHDYLRQLGDPASRSQGCELLVAQDAGGALLGGVSLVHPGSPHGELARADEAEVRMLAIRPDAQGRGVATALMDACARTAAGAGHRALVLSVFVGNARALALYDRLGYVRVPERDWWPEPDVELLAVRRSLGRGDAGQQGPAAG